MHLENEAKIVGPVQYRWMYPIERYCYDSIVLILHNFKYVQFINMFIGLHLVDNRYLCT